MAVILLRIALGAILLQASHCGRRDLDNFTQGRVSSRKVFHPSVFSFLEFFFNHKHVAGATLPFLQERAPLFILMRPFFANFCKNSLHSPGRRPVVIRLILCVLFRWVQRQRAAMTTDNDISQFWMPGCDVDCVGFLLANDTAWWRFGRKGMPFVEVEQVLLARDRAIQLGVNVAPRACFVDRNGRHWWFVCVVGHVYFCAHELSVSAGAAANSPKINELILGLL